MMRRWTAIVSAFGRRSHSEAPTADEVGMEGRYVEFDFLHVTGLLYSRGGALEKCHTASSAAAPPEEAGAVRYSLFAIR